MSDLSQTLHPNSSSQDETPKMPDTVSVSSLPEGWKMVRLGELANIKYGKAKPLEEGSVPAVGSGGVYAYISQALVTFPTLVVGRKGTAGMVWLQEAPFWPSDTTFYLDWITDVIDYRFIYHSLPQ